MSSAGRRQRRCDGADGIGTVILRGSTVASAKALVKGAGTGLPDPTLGGLSSPITAQLVNGSTGVCWEGNYQGTGIIGNEAGLPKAKAVH